MNIESNSQSGQDAWVIAYYGGQRGLSYADVGAGDPVLLSNTYALEKTFGWKGLLCDCQTMDALRQGRDMKSNVLVEDALAADWRAELHRVSGRFGSTIHYLSLDLEPATTTLTALIGLMGSGFRFGLLTVEHDSYRFGPDVREAQRAILRRNGYECVMEDVSVAVGSCFVPFEDWWADPAFIDVRLARQIAGDIYVQSLQRESRMKVEANA